LKQAIPFEISNWEDPEIAAVRVMLQYMTDRMYDKIRGKGWTYGVSMSASVTEGRLTVSFVRSSHIINAYTEFRAIIANYTTMGKKC
jgi:Zn-dependent M16 (insulinase) family peptidase